MRHARYRIEYRGNYPLARRFRIDIVTVGGNFALLRNQIDRVGAIDFCFLFVIFLVGITVTFFFPVWP